MNYKQMKNGDSVELGEKQVLRFTCCDCGLVHDITTDTKARLVFRVNNRATSQQRRRRNIKFVTVEPLIKATK